jgi:hypothetical protein
MMTKIFELAKLSMVYTNHSIRETTITEMDEGGIATTHIMRVSGHKSKESVKHYVRRLSDKKKREISDCLNDTLTNSCGQKFAKTTLPSNTENMSNVGSNEEISTDINTTDVYFLFADTDLQALFDNDFELQNVPPANVPSIPVQSVQSMPVQFNNLMEVDNRNMMPAVSNYNYTVHFNFH